MEIIFKHNTAIISDIENHLTICNNDFSPILTSRIDIKEYATKIRQNASTFEVWENDILVGLNAIYLNDLINQKGFITNISVEQKYNKSGIGTKLLQLSIDYARERGFKSIELEVHSSNTKAIQFYRKNGFYEVKNEVNYHILKINL